MFCASAGTHKCHAASPPRLNTDTSGNSETPNTSTVLFACASLKVLQRIATAISKADRAAASGSSTTKNSSASRRPNWNSACSVSLRNSHCAGRKLKQLSTAISMLRLATAPHLPSTSDQRVDGFISSGSKDPRSRSPAVVSSAAFKAPYNTAISTKNGNMPVTWVARVCVLARSRSSTCIGSSNSGDTPRSARLSVARSRLKPASSRVRRPVPDSACLFALSLTTSSKGASPRSSAASKSTGTTSTGSASVAARNCASKFSGAALMLYVCRSK